MPCPRSCSMPLAPRHGRMPAQSAAAAARRGVEPRKTAPCSASAPVSFCTRRNASSHCGSGHSSSSIMATNCALVRSQRCVRPARCAPARCRAPARRSRRAASDSRRRARSRRDRMPSCFSPSLSATSIGDCGVRLRASPSASSSRARPSRPAESGDGRRVTSAMTRLPGFRQREDAAASSRGRRPECRPAMRSGPKASSRTSVATSDTTLDRVPRRARPFEFPRGLQEHVLRRAHARAPP